MSQWQLTKPVAFFVFNRPDTTALVFETIRRAAPSTLLLVADGPRPDRPGEAERCAAVRAIVEGVDWPCDVHFNFSDINLGCRYRVSTGLNWVFESVEEAIILEDDCLPDQSFFRFCEELLTRYRDDRRIMMISGDNFQFGANRSSDSYYFSRYPHIWGWACWRRSWEMYCADIKLWPQVREGGWLKDCLGRSRLVKYWSDAFESVHRGEIDTWDHQLTFACLVNHALCVVPNRNLVSNIGFGANATHTTEKGPLSELRTEEMQFPLRHPPFVMQDARSDSRTERDFFLPPPIGARVGKLLQRLLLPKGRRE
ncbi:MAG: glycosyltransferase family 2 protein [Geobacter sp.]|nr:MAG: glycosyltransferase family 2 protein [Geobacter sp.]